MKIELHSQFSEELAGEWELLLREVSRYYIQNRVVWIRSYIEHYLDGHNCYFLVVRNESGELVSCLCLQLWERRFYLLSKYRRFQDLGWSVNDFFNVPCKPGYEEAAAICIVRWFRDSTSAWERLQLSYIPCCNSFENVLAKRFAEVFPTVVLLSRSYFKVDTSGEWEDYFTADRNQQLRDVRGRINRIAKNGYTVTTRVIQSGIMEYWDDFIYHFTKRRTEKGEKNSYENLAKVRLIRDVIREGERSGKVQMSVLEDQHGEVWAYQFDLVDRHKGIWYHYAPTFNDKFKQFSPSKVLLFEMLKRAFRDQDIKEFNFMRGEADYKRQFTDVHEEYMQIDVTNAFSRKIKFQKLMGRIVGARRSK